MSAQLGPASGPQISMRSVAFAPKRSARHAGGGQDRAAAELRSKAPNFCSKLCEVFDEPLSNVSDRETDAAPCPHAARRPAWNRGAAAGCVTPSRSKKLCRARLWRCNGASCMLSTGEKHASLPSSNMHQWSRVCDASMRSNSARSAGQRRRRLRSLRFSRLPRRDRLPTMLWLKAPPFAISHE